MKLSVFIVCLGVAACGGTTNGAQCGPGTTLVNGQCVVASIGAGGGAAGSGAEPEAGAMAGQAGGMSVDSGAVPIRQRHADYMDQRWLDQRQDEPVRDRGVVVG